MRTFFPMRFGLFRKWNISLPNMSEGNRDILSVIDHLTRSITIKNLEITTTDIARSVVEGVLPVFGPPETLHSDQGTELDNQRVKRAQDVFGHKKTV